MNFYRLRKSLRNSDINFTDNKKTFNVYRIVLISLIYIIATITIFAISYDVTTKNYTEVENLELDDLQLNEGAENATNQREITVDELNPHYNGDYNEYYNGGYNGDYNEYYNGGYNGDYNAYDNEYILKDINGRVAVFKANDYEPFMLLELYTNTLPYVDRQNLLEGITIIGDDNLRQLIEDFDS